MKNQFTSRIVKFTFAFMFVLIASSCSQDDEAMDAADQLNAELSIIKTKTNSQLLAGKLGDPCVASFPTTAEEVYSNTTFGVSVTAYNDADNTYVTISRSGGKVMTVRYAQPGLTTTQTTAGTILDAGATVSVTIPHESGWEHDDAVTFSFYVSGLGGGSDNKFQTGIITYYLKALCDDGCDESFSYVDNSGGSYTFTYIPAESVSGALVVFTFAQAVAISGFDGTYSNNGQTVQKTMDLKACENYTWEVTLVKNCNAGAPNNNIWTDFKVGGISKKNSETPNIVASCN